jgi:hypothetical protein
LFILDFVSLHPGYGLLDDLGDRNAVSGQHDFLALFGSGD